MSRGDWTKHLEVDHERSQETSPWGKYVPPPIFPDFITPRG